jgi:predicted membrane channel-forming protein YqfA (hemolysin III family)
MEGKACWSCVVFDYWLGCTRDFAVGISPRWLYTVGAVLFYMQKPKLSPEIFGFHEIWHVFTVVAGILQFAGVGVLISRVG